MHPGLKSAFLLGLLGWATQTSAEKLHKDSADLLEALIPLRTASSLVVPHADAWSQGIPASSMSRAGAEMAEGDRRLPALIGLKTQLSRKLRLSVRLDPGRIIFAVRRGGVAGSAVQSWHETRREVYTSIDRAPRIGAMALGERWRVEGFCAVKLGEGPVPRAGGVTLAFRP